MMVSNSRREQSNQILKGFPHALLASDMPFTCRSGNYSQAAKSGRNRRDELCEGILQVLTDKR